MVVALSLLALAAWLVALRAGATLMLASVEDRPRWRGQVLAAASLLLMCLAVYLGEGAG